MEKNTGKRRKGGPKQRLGSTHSKPLHYKARNLQCKRAVHVLVYASSQVVTFWLMETTESKSLKTPNLTRMINLLKPTGYVMHQQVQHSTIARSAHTRYKYVMYLSQNKQRLLPYTTKTDWFL